MAKVYITIRRPRVYSFTLEGEDAQALAKLAYQHYNQTLEDLSDIRQLPGVLDFDECWGDSDDEEFLVEDAEGNYLGDAADFSREEG